MKRAVHAEWTKLRTSAGLLWAAPAIALTTIAVGWFTTCDARYCDPVKASLSGVQLSQAVVAILAVLVIGGEYGTGMMRVTLTAIPRRLNLLAAKAIVLTAVVTPAATAGVIVAGDGWHARPFAGSVLYLVLIGLLSLGVGAAVRQPAAAIGVVLGLLYVFPLLASAVPGEVWQKRLERIGPMSAGLAVQATRGLPDLPISPGKGLAVLAVWTVAAMLAGWLVVRFRDG